MNRKREVKNKIVNFRVPLYAIKSEKDYEQGLREEQILLRSTTPSQYGRPGARYPSPYPSTPTASDLKRVTIFVMFLTSKMFLPL
jgi:hypothetical protein